MEEKEGLLFLANKSSRLGSEPKMKLKLNNSTQSGYFRNLQVQNSCLNFCDPTALSFEPLLAWLTNLMEAYKSENPLVN